MGMPISSPYISYYDEDDLLGKVLKKSEGLLGLIAVSWVIFHLALV